VPATILDGRALAESLRGEIALEVRNIIGRDRFTPTLAVVWMGEDPASRRYVRQIRTAFEKMGFGFELHTIPALATQDDLLGVLSVLNGRGDVHGILIQVPLPAHVRLGDVSLAIAEEKDVDGIHPANAGRLFLGIGDYMAPATPSGGIALLERSGIAIAGTHAIVVGRSATVGRPMALMLLQRHATVTMCHTRTVDLPGLIRQGDIVVAAAGVPGLIHGSMIRPGAVVIDFGVNVHGDTVVGDVDFESAMISAGAITPVPGGTGPLTIVMLMRNTVAAARRSLSAQA
jgi:methylenetetrahydrofolate dehydrogenase (NADP+) / methenyltetrahydrofolate cyclohydrolase